MNSALIQSIRFYRISAIRRLLEVVTFVYILSNGVWAADPLPSKVERINERQRQELKREHQMYQHRQGTLSFEQDQRLQQQMQRELNRQRQLQEARERRIQRRDPLSEGPAARLQELRRFDRDQERQRLHFRMQRGADSLRR